MSVSGGWNGLPAQPRMPLNFLPLSVIAGRTENRLIRVPPRRRPSFDIVGPACLLLSTNAVIERTKRSTFPAASDGVATTGCAGGQHGGPHDTGRVGIGRGRR